MVKNYLFLGGVFLTVLSPGCSRPQPDTSEIVRPVRVQEVIVGQATASESYPAQIEPRYDSILGFQVGGRLLERPAEVGDRVKVNQILARLDPKDLRLALEAAQAQLQAAQTEFNQMQTDLERALDLKNKGFVSQAELDRRQLSFDAANSRLRQAKAQYSVQSNQSQYGALRAPREGVVTSVHAEVGQVMAPGQPVLGWADENAVQVRISVPETRIDAFHAGRKASVKLWSGTQTIDATVREVSPVADPVTRTYNVYLDLANVGSEVRFGMSATVDFKNTSVEDRIKIPVSAVAADGLGAFVWVFNESKGEVAKRRIAANEVDSDGVVIDKGLSQGDLVVVAGTHLLADGQKVRKFIEVDEIKKQVEEKRREVQPK